MACSRVLFLELLIGVAPFGRSADVNGIFRYLMRATFVIDFCHFFISCQLSAIGCQLQEGIFKREPLN